MAMTVNQIMTALRLLQKDGHGKTKCEIFAHDQNPENADEGDGGVFSVFVITQDNGRVIVGIKA